jgi:hypothetical protein
VDLKQGSNDEFGPKDIFEIASKKMLKEIVGSDLLFLLKG